MITKYIIFYDYIGISFLIIIIVFFFLLDISSELFLCFSDWEWWSIDEELGFTW